jgi:sugar phosphate isomerase/epimerase
MNLRMIPMMKRFLCLVSATALGITLSCGPAFGEVKIPDQYKIGGFALGVQAYSFNHFTAFEAIEKTAQAGGRVIEFYPGQKLSKEEPEVRLDHHMADEHIEKLKAKLKHHDILPVNYGVVGLPNNEEESRKVFEFAKKLSLRAVTSEARPEALDLIEKLVKEYDIMMGIHNHASRTNDPSYRYWDPNYVLSLVQGRDRRLGACADTGHWVRSGVKPVDGLKILEDRIISLHLKDLHEFSRGGHDMPFGMGVSDVPGILDELKRQGFEGNISIEYEFNWLHSVPDIAQCVGFVRGYTARQK